MYFEFAEFVPVFIGRAVILSVKFVITKKISTESCRINELGESDQQLNDCFDLNYDNRISEVVSYHRASKYAADLEHSA